jgi:hypothetical protein
MGAIFIFIFHFLGIKVLVKFDQKLENLLKFTFEKFKKFKKINFLCQKMVNFHPQEKTLAASRTRQVSTKVNGETHEKLGQSAKKSLPVHGQGRNGSYSGRQTSARCDRAKSRDFLPARVWFGEDCGQISFSSCFFLHVRVLREIYMSFRIIIM